MDIMAEDFDAAAYGLSAEQVRAALYGIKPDGTVTVGMASLREAYRLAGVGWMIGWTGWWPARPAVPTGSTAGSPATRMSISRALGRCDGDCRV